MDQQVTVRRPLPAGVEAGLPQNRHAAADNGGTHHLNTHIHRHITAGAREFEACRHNCSQLHNSPPNPSQLHGLQLFVFSDFLCQFPVPACLNAPTTAWVILVRVQPECGPCSCLPKFPHCGVGRTCMYLGIVWSTGVCVNGGLS